MELQIFGGEVSGDFEKKRAELVQLLVEAFCLNSLAVVGEEKGEEVREFSALDGHCTRVHREKYFAPWSHTRAQICL